MKSPGIFALLPMLLALAGLAAGQEPQSQRVQEPESRIIVVPQPPPVVICPETISVWLWTDRNTYWEGDDVEISFRVSHDSFLYLFSTDPSGQTRMIFPNRQDRDNYLRAGRTYSIPDRHYRLVATGPSGFDALHAIATTERYDWIERRYQPMRYSETFPIVKQSPREFSAEVQKSAQAEVDKVVGSPAARPGEPNKITVVPVPPRPDRWNPPGYGEAIHTVRIRGRSFGWDVRPPRPPRYEPPCPNPPDCYVEAAQLRISSSPSRATVFIDGVNYGRTPLDIKIQPGTYDILVVKDDYAPWQTRVRLEPGRRESFTFALKRERW